MKGAGHRARLRTFIALMAGVDLVLQRRQLPPSPRAPAESIRQPAEPASQSAKPALPLEAGRAQGGPPALSASDQLMQLMQLASGAWVPGCLVKTLIALPLLKKMAGLTPAGDLM